MFIALPRLTQFAPAPSGSVSEYDAETELPVRIIRIHHVGRFPVPRPRRVPSTRVPPVSVSCSKYVATAPVGAPSALRVFATLIQLSLVWKIFSPTWAYWLPTPPT